MAFIRIRRTNQEALEHENKMRSERARLSKQIEQMERLKRQREMLKEKKRKYNELKYGRAKKLGRKTLGGLARLGSRIGENTSQYYGWKR